MKTFLALGLIALSCTGCSTTRPAPADAHLLPALRPYVNEVANEFATLPAERKVVLGKIATDILTQLREGKPANLTFICTHNSRRSHMSQIWAQTAACYYGLNQVHAYSGGTEVTACNCRTVTAMRRVGFDIQDATAGDNPIYLVRYAEDRPVIRAYSKLYNADGNPKQDFIALMTCSSADKSCPIVEGAIARHAIHYVMIRPPRRPLTTSGAARSPGRCSSSCPRCAARRAPLLWRRGVDRGQPAGNIRPGSI
jgi:arsenate reductase